MFCPNNIKGKIIFRTDYFNIIEDEYPVNQGHMLIIPKRHIEDINQIDHKEWVDLFFAIQLTKLKQLQKYPNCDGFNIGINEGKAAGQTINHLHIHIIPRYVGDVENPKGGIRNFKKPLVEY
jgi:diadenosine tetraphosphate (Ap4A) HIT family hydrolase